VIVFGFLIHLFKVYPKVDYSVPFKTGMNDYHITSIDDVNLLVYHDLPYPTDFEVTTYPSQNLDGGWKMRRDPNDAGIDDGWHRTTEPGDDWTDVVIPESDIEAEGPITEYYGVAWFFHVFSPDFTADDEAFVRLGFSDKGISTDVWLNGEHLGDHRGGGGLVYFDISDHLLSEENVLIIRIDNRPGSDTLPVKTWERDSQGWIPTGGISGDVVLEKIPRHYICKAVTDMAVTMNRGEVSISVIVHNHDITGPYILSGTLIAPDGGEIDLGSYIFESSDEFEVHILECEVENPKTWSSNHPWLYRLVLTMKTKHRVETLETKTGFRSVRIVGYGTDPGIHINDINTFIRGISWSDGNQAPDAVDRDLDLIQEMNANFIRMAHSPHDVREIRECRDRGIMVSEEIPFHAVGMGWIDWYQAQGSWFELPVRTFGMRQLTDPALMSMAQRRLIEMVERDINNPAVIMWITGSETYTLFDDGGRFSGWMRDVIRSFDDTRPVCTAEYTYNNHLLDGRNHAAEYMDLIAVDSFFGWRYETPDDLGPYLDHIHRRYPDRLLFLSDFGAGTCPEYINSADMDTEEYQALLLETYVDIARSRKYVTGVCPSILSDEVTPDESTAPEDCMGVMTNDREAKIAYDVLKLLYEDIKTDGK